MVSMIYTWEGHKGKIKSILTKTTQFKAQASWKSRRFAIRKERWYISTGQFQRRFRQSVKFSRFLESEFWKKASNFDLKKHRSLHFIKKYFLTAYKQKLNINCWTFLLGFKLQLRALYTRTMKFIRKFACFNSNLWKPNDKK